MSIIQGTAKAAGGGYTIAQSIRFDGSAYLTRTPSSAGNRKKFTISWWMKLALADVSANDTLFASYSAGNDFFAVSLMRDDATFSSELYFQSQVANVNVINKMTAQVFRDPSAWYHCVLVIDTDNGTAEDRNILYVNGTRVTNWSSSYNTNATSGHTTYWNNTNAHTISSINSSSYYDGYMAEIYNIDGQALDASSFGKVDSTTGQWVPVDASGLTFGTNGFYITGENSASLGTDYSGNGNNFTSSGLTSADQVLDTPTNNYAVLNPLIVGHQATLSDGNLGFSLGSDDGVCSSFPTGDTGTWRFRVNITALGAQGAIAVLTEDAFTAVTNWGSINLGGGAGQYAYRNNGDKYSGGTATAYGASFTAGDYVEAEYDADAGTLTFYKNGSSQGTAYTGLSGRMFLAFSRNASGGTSVDGSVDFGQLSTVGGTALALCTTNLPDPTIALPGEHFNTVLWTGDGATSRTISGVGFNPDFVWAKSRSAATTHKLMDDVRGANLQISSDQTAAEVDVTTGTSGGGLGTTTADGFTLVSGTSNANNVNASGTTFVAWNWKANGSGSSNTDGSITSTVSANTANGFSIVTYTGNATIGATIGHGLGAVPNLILIKNRTDVQEWGVYSSVIGATQWLKLNATDAATVNSSPFNNTAPTSSVFTVDGSGGYNAVNGSGDSYVAYCFAEVEGFSKFTSYEGNASYYPFIYCGFRPSFVLIKNADAAEEWWIQDAAREPYNGGNMARLAPNSSAAEADNVAWFDFLSNGLKVRYNAGGINSSGTHIVMAFAESPFKTANAR